MLSDPTCIEGDWFDGESSRRQRALFRLDATGYVSLSVEGTSVRRCRFDSLEISTRLGNTPRRIAFPDGGSFETRENDRLDQWQARWQPTGWRWLHELESRWPYVLVGLLCVVGFALWVAVRGVPMAAEHIAQVLPQQIAERVGQHTLAQLDDLLLQPSQLDDAELARLQELMQQVLSEWPELPLQVVFRDGGALGPNALALPDGTLVFTDQMIALAAHDDELLAVLAHEVGHIASQHGMKMLVRNALFGFLLVAMSGDVTLSSELLLAAPLLLLELSHSRQYEAQADDFALAWLQKNGRAPEHFVNLMARLRQVVECHPAESEAAQLAESAKTNTDEEREENYLRVMACYRELTQRYPKATSLPDTEASEKEWSTYLSSHPPTEERLRKFSE